MRRARLRPELKAREPGRVSGCVQLGVVSVWIGERDASGSAEYIVEAPIVPYFGLKPKAGETPWVLQHGRSADADETIVARCAALYRDHALVHFDGSLAAWPYQAAARPQEGDEVADGT